MPGRYAAFRVDPTLNFDNFVVDHSAASSPVVPSFSRPTSTRPALSIAESKSFSTLSDFSRPPSDSDSSYRGPETPRFETTSPELKTGFVTRTSTYDADIEAHGISFMRDSKSPELDLSFSFEKSSGFGVAISPLPSPSLHSQCTMQHTSSKHVCPVHGPKQALPPIPIKDTRYEDPRDPPPTRPSLASFQPFPDRRDSLAETPTTPSSPAFHFLNQDPFQSSRNGDGMLRPKSAGAGASHDDESDFNFDRVYSKKKQSAPSIMSSKSTRSMKKGLSRMKRIILNRTRTE